MVCAEKGAVYFSGWSDLRYVLKGEVDEAETVVMVVVPKADTGLGSWEVAFDRSNDVSGTQTIMKNTANAWMMLRTMSSFRKLSWVWEMKPPRIGDPQVNIKLTTFRRLILSPRSCTCSGISERSTVSLREALRRKHLE